MYRPIFFLLLAGTANFALAQNCSEIADNEKRLKCFDSTEVCARITSDTERLECFDHTYAAMSITEQQGAHGIEPVDAVVAENTNKDFGKRWRDEGETVAFIETTIVEVKSNTLGIDYLRLDNGHVWREISDSRVRFKVGQKVTITEGVLGSFNLRVQDVSKFVKVKRLK